MSDFAVDLVRPAEGMVVVSRAAMGTQFQVVLGGPDPEYLRIAGEQALEEVDRAEERLSHYRPTSDLCDLNQWAQYGPTLVEPRFLALLRRAVEVSELTGGAFDPTAGALIRCWGFFRGQGAMPTAEAVQEAKARVGAYLLEIDSAARTVGFRQEGVQLHLGAIGKGHAVDQVVDLLRELRIKSALVHGGTSTVYALGAPPGAEAWLVGLCDPGNRERRIGVVRLRDRALSTSGDYEQFFEAAGRRYSHILDPRTGWPAQGVRSATVVTGNATDSDALSTAAFVTGPGTDIHRRFPDTGLIIVPDPGAGRQEVVVLGDVEVTSGDDSVWTRERTDS